MKIATFNINNINKRLSNLLEWLGEVEPDVVCLQELKAAHDDFPKEAIEAAGYGAVWRGERSWNGVAILARDSTPIVTRDALPGDPADSQSRYIEAAVNGVLVTYLKVPAFIATLTTLLIGRGFVLGLTGGKNIAFAPKARDYPAIFSLGETNALGFNNQIVIFLVVAVIGAIVLAKTRWGYETSAVGGNEQAAGYAGINTNWVRIRAYLLSSLCATLAGLMAIFQDKGVTAQYGLNAELIVIAAVIIGGASIMGGRGRVIGSCLGALLTVLINKVLREGWPVTRTILIDGQETQVNAVATLPAGAAVQTASDWVVLDALLHALDAGQLHAQVDADVRASLEQWQKWLAKNAGDGAVAASRAEAAATIGKYLADPKSVKLRPLPTIPPGAPI